MMEIGVIEGQIKEFGLIENFTNTISHFKRKKNVDKTGFNRFIQNYSS